MQIIADNIWAYPDSHLDLIEQALTYQAQGARFSKAYQNGWWDGLVCLLNNSKQGQRRFPSGLVPFVRKFLSAFDIKSEVIYLNNTLPVKQIESYSPTELLNLDSNQEIAIEKILQHGRGIIKYPTGYGKTRVIGEAIRLLKLPTLILSNRLDWAYQLKGDLEPVIGDTVGLMTGKDWDIQNCTVGMVQTLCSKMQGLKDYLQGIGLVIVDEAQYAAGDSYAQVLSAIEHADYRIGMSATPFKHNGKMDDLKVIGWIGEVIANLGNIDGIEAGRIVPADIYMISGLESTTTWLNYKEGIQRAIVENMPRNKAIVKLVADLKQAGKPTLIIVDRIEHGRILELIGGSNIEFVHGGSGKEERQEAWEGFKAGKISCLAVSKIGDEALNLPNIEALILAGGGKLATRQIQRIGRGMRAYGDKERVMVFDFYDLGKYLEGHSKKRLKLYKSDPAYNIIQIAWEELK